MKEKNSSCLIFSLQQLIFLNVSLKISPLWTYNIFPKYMSYFFVFFSDKFKSCKKLLVMIIPATYSVTPWARSWTLASTHWLWGEFSPPLWLLLRPSYQLTQYRIYTSHGYFSSAIQNKKDVKHYIFSLRDLKKETENKIRKMDAEVVNNNNSDVFIF